MKKIERNMIDAIINKKSVIFDNTEIEYSKALDLSTVYLFGNTIADYNHATKEMRLSDADWQTQTTKSRLNALGGNIRQIKFAWYNNGKIWRRNSFNSIGQVILTDL